MKMETETKMEMEIQIQREETNYKSLKKQGLTCKSIVLFVQALCGVTACALTLVWCVYYRGGLAFQSSNKYHISNVHAVFSFIGFIFLASEAILAYRFIPLEHGGQKTVHMAFLGIAILVGVPGICAIFKFQKASGISRDFYSLHSWLGLSTIFLFILQWVVGLCAFLYPRLPKKTRALFLPRHRIVGLFVYGIAIFTAVTGFTEKLILFEVRGLNQFSPEAMLVNATAIVTILFGMFVVLSVLLP